MFVVFALLLTTVIAHRHQKYIDLLPEEEKQQFLDKIARRIMETVEDVDGKNKFSKGNAGGELKQEAGHLRKRRADNKKSEEENNAEENLDVIPLNEKANDDSDKIDTSSDDENSSFSVEIKRRSYDDTLPKKSKSDEVIKNTNLRTDSESNEKVVKQLPEKKSKEELTTEKLKDPEISISDNSGEQKQTEEAADMISTTEPQDLNIDETDYNASTTYEPNKSGADLDLIKTIDYIKSDEVTEHSYVRTDDESNEKVTVKQLSDKKSYEEEGPTDKSKEPELSTVDFEMQTEVPDIISTIESLELTVEETNYNASTTFEPNRSGDEDDPKLKKATNYVKGDEVTKITDLTTIGKSNEKGTVEQLTSKESKEDETPTDNFTEPETSTTDYEMQKEETADIISTTESQDLITVETKYNMSTTSEPSKPDEKGDPILKKTTNYTKRDEVIKKSNLTTEGERNEKGKVEQLPNRKPKEEGLPTERLKDPEAATGHFETQTEEPLDMISTTEFQDSNTDETASMTYEPNESGDKNDVDFREESVTKTIGKAMLSLDVDSDDTTTSSIAESKTKVRKTSNSVTKYKSAVNNTNNGSAITAEYLNNNSTTGPKSEPSYSNTQTAIIFTSSIADEGRKDDFSTDVTMISRSDHLTPSSSATKLNITTTTNHPPLSENKVRKVVLTTTILPVLTTENAELLLTSESPKKTRFKIISKPSENTKSVNKIANNSKKVEVEDELNKKQLLNHKKNDMTTERNISLPPYQVYEIPWPDSSETPPFLRSAEPMKKSSFPVYKNSPNYLHYNPTNHLKPNATKVDTIDRNARRLREGKNSTDDEPASSVGLTESVTNQTGEIRKFGVYKKQPQKYIEEPTLKSTTLSPEDANFEEQNSVTELLRFPDSHEKGHPFHSMKKGHFNAIKGVLFKQKINGEEPLKKNEYVSYLYDKYNSSYQSGSGEGYIDLAARRDHNTKIDNIDYYFDTMNHVNRKTNTYIKDLHHLQVQNHPIDQKMSDLLIANYVEDKHHHIYGKRPTVLTSANSEEDYNFTTIVKILTLADEKDVFTTLEQMQDMNFKLMRRNDDVKVSIYLKALSDLIDQDSKALKQYDWLATTVQIQSALEKLFLLIHKLNESKPIHPADVEILKYVIFMHNFLIELKGANNFKSQLKDYVKLLTRKKIKKGNKGLKEKRLLHKVWLYLRKLLPDLTVDDGLNNLNEFLLDIEEAIYDLHVAITTISKVTKFKHQNWFENLRQLYLTTTEKHLLQLLLHISFSRLIELIESSCENGLEDNFIKFMKTHKKESKRTLEEMVFVSKIIDEIKGSLE